MYLLYIIYACLHPITVLWCFVDIRRRDRQFCNWYSGYLIAPTTFRFSNLPSWNTSSICCLKCCRSSCRSLLLRQLKDAQRACPLMRVSPVILAVSVLSWSFHLCNTFCSTNPLIVWMFFSISFLVGIPNWESYLTFTLFKDIY